MTDADLDRIDQANRCRSDIIRCDAVEAARTIDVLIAEVRRLRAENACLREATGGAPYGRALTHSHPIDSLDADKAEAEVRPTPPPPAGD